MNAVKEKINPLLSEDLQTFLLRQGWRVVDYWFLRYNPFYFFSAFCILLGIYLVSAHLAPENWFIGQILLTGVIQVYELFVIASAALLFRIVEQYRPAVFLGILELFFLYDVAFRNEVFAGLDGSSIPMIILWLALAAAKLIGLRWAFRLQAPPIVIILGTLAAAGIGFAPYLLIQPGINITLAQLAGNWYGAWLFMAVIGLYPQIQCAAPLDEWGKTVHHRAVNAYWSIALGLYFFHLWNNLLWLEPPERLYWLVAQAAPWVFCAGLASRNEEIIWQFTAVLAFLFFFIDSPPLMAKNALLGGLTLGGWVFYTKLTPRLYVAALLLIYIGIWFFNAPDIGVPPLPPWWVNLAIAAGLLFVGIYWHVTLAGLILAGGALFSARHTVPQTGLGWGIFMLALGFATLAAGVGISWLQRSRSRSNKSLAVNENDDKTLSQK